MLSCGFLSAFLPHKSPQISETMTALIKKNKVVKDLLSPTELRIQQQQQQKKNLTLKNLGFKLTKQT